MKAHVVMHDDANLGRFNDPTRVQGDHGGAYTQPMELSSMQSKEVNTRGIRRWNSEGDRRCDFMGK
jgi:hypothetical protein